MNSMIPIKEFAERRRKLMERMAPDSIAIIPAAPERVRNRDVLHPFRCCPRRRIRALGQRFYSSKGIQPPIRIARRALWSPGGRIAYRRAGVAGDGV